jgi:hypothetical protein
MYNYNTGNGNTGSRNTGNWNTGNGNTGNGNTGSRNTGNWNTGDGNTGSGNTGSGNTGNGNTGSGNTGNGNTGHWNSSSFCTGYFNTIDQPVFIFNKPALVSRDELDMYANIHLTEWILPENMSEEEKKENPEWETSEGYLKQRTFHQACQLWWNESENEEKNKFLNLPNFDVDLFKEITGIQIMPKKQTY